MKSNKINRLKNLFLLLILFLGINPILKAQVSKAQWQVDNTRSDYKNEELLIHKMPKHFAIYDISISIFSKKMKKKSQEISIPNPNGEFEIFEIEPSNTVAKEVAHLYTIKTFKGFKKDNPSVKIACDISDGGFHAAVYEASMTYFITPLLKNVNNKVLVYYNSDREAEKITCQVTKHSPSPSATANRTPTAKSTYRLAITAAGEYSQQFGGSPYNATNVLNALASGVNIINPIYLRDLGIEFTLVSTAALVFQNPNTDPYPNTGDPNDGNVLVMQSHAQCTNALGTNGFDIGHLVIWDDIGGLADFGGVCDEMFKGEGYSGSKGITTLWVDYVCHEMGHQFGADHNFVSQECGTSQENHRYEPGEGSSIMSYANVCGPPAQYANASDPFFHYASINQIQTYLNTIPSCAITNAAGNTASPTPDAKSNITIPKETPFILVGEGTDANDAAGNLTFGWQQYDGNSPDVEKAPDCHSTNAPLFRYRPPASVKFRSFPQYNDVLAGNNNAMDWEKLPCTARTLNFSLAVRDNNSSFGRVKDDKMVVTVTNTGPFAVTAPNGGETLTGNTSSTITWSVNGTNSHCSNVDILLSTDGGASYSVIADATANDGTESITVPNTATSMARVLVRCDVAGGFRAASTFYDVSNSNFSITSVLPIELVRFYGEPVGATNRLNWATFSELNNDGFEVQRLIEGSRWESLGFVAGAGNSSEKQSYTYLDRSPVHGTTFYRLEQFDVNGESSFSNIIAITNENTGSSTHFYPNPSSDKITFTNVMVNTGIEIFDAQGQLVFQTHLNNSNSLDISNLVSGVYFMFIDENGARAFHKLIKN